MYTKEVLLTDQDLHDLTDVLHRYIGLLDSDDDEELALRLFNLSDYIAEYMVEPQ